MNLNLPASSLLVSASQSIPPLSILSCLFLASIQTICVCAKQYFIGKTIVKLPGWPPCHCVQIGLIKCTEMVISRIVLTGVHFQVFYASKLRCHNLSPVFKSVSFKRMAHHIKHWSVGLRKRRIKLLGEVSFPGNHLLPGHPRDYQIFSLEDDQYAEKTTKQLIIRISLTYYG